MIELEPCRCTLTTVIAGVTDKLERDVAEILEAFEEYKERTGTAPEKVQELKHGELFYVFIHVILTTDGFNQYP